MGALNDGMETGRVSWISHIWKCGILLDWRFRPRKCDFEPRNQEPECWTLPVGRSSFGPKEFSKPCYCDRNSRSFPCAEVDIA